MPDLRRLNPADAPTYRALMLEAYAGEPQAFTSSHAERAALPLAWWVARLSTQAPPRELVLGAFVDGVLAGAAGLAFETRERTRHKATLFGLYVQPARRGAGLGVALVHEVMAWAQRSPGLEIVQLSVTAGNATGLRLYTRCGFVPYGTEPQAVKLGEAYLAKLHLWCRVPGPTAP